jgi:hypothetical protein
LGKEVAVRDAELCPGGKHAKAGFAQRDVLIVSAIDDVVQQRVAEHGPPAGQIIVRRTDTLIGGVDPFASDRRTRRRVDWTNFAIVMKVFANAGATTEDSERKRNRKSQIAE